MHEVHTDLGPGLPEYIYQEALAIQLKSSGFNDAEREYRHHPIYKGKEMESYVRMDILVPMNRGNIIIECKSIEELTGKERYQTFGYLRATEFPIAILVNFGTWPKAQIERYYYDRKNHEICAF